MLPIHVCFNYSYCSWQGRYMYHAEIPPRSALLQQMVPLYVVPFEELRPAKEAVMAEVSGKERLNWRVLAFYILHTLVPQRPNTNFSSRY